MQELLEYAIKQAEKRGATQAEAFYSAENRLQTTIEKKQVKISEKKYDAGIGIRVAVKKTGGYSIGFAYLTNLTKETAAKTVQQALKVASFKKPDRDFKSFQERKPAKTVQKIFDKTIAKVEPETIADLANDLIKAASSDNRITTIIGGINLRTGRVDIANSLGVSGEFNTSGYGVSAYAVAQETDSIGVGWDEYSNCCYNEKEAYAIFKNATNGALKQLHPRAIKTEKIDLLIQPQALTSILAFTLIPEVMANNIQRQQSPFVGRLNQTIASTNLSVIDDAHVPQALGSKPFDDEGCPTQMTKIIERGVLRNFLHNSYTAKKDKVKPTGNSLRSLGVLGSMRPKYSVEPVIGPTNFEVSAEVKGAQSSFDEVVSEVKNGVISKGVVGAHTANAPSGEFSVALDMAFKIEKGEIACPIKQAMIGGNIQDFIKNIAMFADDTTQVGFEHASVIAPTILVKNITVSG
jgi:PmbA protein